MTVLDPRLRNINAAMLSNSTYNRTYNDYSRGMLQNKIDEEFYNATDVFTIQEEQTPGMLDWVNIDVRITHVLSDKNTSDKKNDDWRQLIFKDIAHNYALGVRYFFDNNYWLTVQSDYYHYPTASATIRRCNNQLKWYDSTGILRQEPCIIDDKIQRYRNEYNQYIITYEGYITVLCQLNKFTKDIVINQKFIFNGQAYKVLNIQNYFNKTTFGDDAPLLTLTMNRDMNNTENDDLADNIANNAYRVTPSSTPTIGNYILPDVTSILQGDTQQYSVFHYVNSVPDSTTFTITASGVSSNYYTLTVVDGNHFNVTNLQMSTTKLIVTCTNNTDQSTIQISITLKGLW